LEGCLSGSSTVHTRQRGPIQLRDLKLNDSVLTYTPGVGSHFTEFLGWLTRSSSSPTLMLKISTSTNSSLTLTPSHIIFRLSGKGDHESVYAGQLVKGDRLMKSRDGAVELDEVVEIQVVWEEGGYWAPLTKEGTLVANRFLVSSFALFPHHLCQQVSAFLRIFLVLDDEASQHEDGERQVVTVAIKTLEMFGLRGWIPAASASETNKQVNTMPSLDMSPSLDVKVAEEKILHMSDHIELWLSNILTKMVKAKLCQVPIYSTSAFNFFLHIYSVLVWFSQIYFPKWITFINKGQLKNQIFGYRGVNHNTRVIVLELIAIIIHDKVISWDSKCCIDTRDIYRKYF